MSLNQIILSVMALGAVLGGLDCVLGNRFGLGEKFESGFLLLGPVALSMAGIICLAPLLSGLLGMVVGPVCAVLNMDPGIFGSILAIDMGGYSLAMELAEDPALGRFSGIILTSIFGCTVVFSIPVGIGFLKQEERGFFTRGILLGMTVMPAAIVVGGLVMGLNLWDILWNSLPVLLVSALLAAGMLLRPEEMLRGFLAFAGMVKAAAILGLTLAAVTQLTGIALFPAMTPLEEAMEVICSICVAALGCMPLAELTQRLMKKPFRWIQEKTGLNSASTTALLLGLFTATPALALLPEMDKRGKVVISACLVSGICSFGAHFAFTNSCEPELVPALLAAKLVGCILGGAVAMAVTRNTETAQTAAL